MTRLEELKTLVGATRAKKMTSFQFVAMYDGDEPPANPD